MLIEPLFPVCTKKVDLLRLRPSSGKLEIVTKSVLNLPNLFMLIKQGSQSRPRNFMEWKMNEFFVNLSEGFPGGGISQMFFWGILNRKITHLHGHSLGILYSGSTSSFPELLQKDHSPFAIETSNVWVLNYAKWKKISPWDNELHFFIKNIEIQFTNNLETKTSPIRNSVISR